MKKRPHGGRRPGAGRPRRPGVPFKLTLRLEPHQIARIVDAAGAKKDDRRTRAELIADGLARLAFESAEYENALTVEVGRKFDDKELRMLTLAGDNLTDAELRVGMSGESALVAKTRALSEVERIYLDSFLWRSYRP